MKNKKLILIIVMFLLFGIISFMNFVSAPAMGSRQLGCCFDSSIGTCSPNSYESDCSSGTWSSDADCQSNSHCQEGCCMLGTSTGFITQRLCQLEADSRGFEFNWNPGLNEQQCTEQGNSLDKGACLYIGEYENDCVFTSSSQCNTNEFYPGILCTAPELNTSCKRTERTTLVEGKDGIYYLDSCDNIGNIYDSEKYYTQDYWTYVVSEQESCGFNDAEGNANSQTCGNCNFEKGSIGRQKKGFTEYGNYYCADLDCGFVDGAKRKNGDSWCVTDISGTFMDISNTNAPLFTKGVNEEGESVPVPDVTKITYYTDTGYKMEFKGYAKADTWRHGVITEPGGTKREFDVNSLVRKNQATQQQSEEIVCEGDHGDKIRVTIPAGSEKAGHTYEMYSDGWSPDLDKRVTSAYRSPEIGMTGEIESVKTEIESYMDSSVGVGTRYMKKFCLNGKVHNEPCGDMRYETCETDSNGNAQCVNNPWQECLSVSVDSEENTGEEIKENCDSRYCKLMKIPSKLGGEVACNTEESDSEDEENQEDEIDMMEDLELSLCVPKIAGGQRFWPEEGSFTTSEEGGVCSIGNYETDILFKASDRRWYLHLDKELENYFHNAGVLIEPFYKWDDYDDSDDFLGGINKYITYSIKKDGALVQHVYDGYERYIPVNEEVIGFLNSRCNSLGDCNGKLNWNNKKGEGLDGSNAKEVEINIEDVLKDFSGLGIKYSKKYKEDDTPFIEFPFEFECKPFKAPSSGDCEQCQESAEETGLPCTEYRCKSLGQNCEWNSEGGKGYCNPSNDYSPPIIGHLKNPSGEVPPYEPIEITITTDEVSHCKFAMGNPGVTYEEMNYNVDSNWSKKHKVRLNLPGQSTINDEFAEYNLIQGEGRYEMYVKCKDTVGNPNRKAHLIRFNVMDTPDENPAYIQEFIPEDGSAILFNTTEKEIEFKINEPAECSWDFEDVAYNQMSNRFNCDETFTDEGSLEGYWCSGTLTNMTNNTNEKTKYFIRCKDQPWLKENNPNPEYYSRNVNSKSEKYELRASEKFEIKSFNPKNEITKGPQDTSIELIVETLGGGYNGKSSCKWRIIKNPNEENYTSLFYDFSETDSSIHKQILTNKTEGKYEIQIKCEDKAENIVNETFSFKFNIDDETPEITRVFKSGNNLKILTSEEAKCYFDYWKNNFILENGTSMTTGFSKEHTAKWNSGFQFNIKCLDVWENQKSGAQIIRPGIF